MDQEDGDEGSDGYDDVEGEMMMVMMSVMLVMMSVMMVMTSAMMVMMT